MDDPRHRTTATSRRLLGAIAVLSLLAAGLLTLAVILQVGPARWDPAVTRTAVSLRAPVATDVLQAVTSGGGTRAVVSLTLLLVALLVLLRRPRQAALSAVTMVGSEVVTEVMKVLVGRPRPPSADRIGDPAATHSFPSGHTLNSAVLLGLVVLLLWPTASRVVRAVTLGGAVVLTAAVATSRVYLGYHWLSDVVASVLIAVSWLLAVSLLAARIRPGVAARTASAPVASTSRTR